jgi:hypothetical protein
MVISFPLTMTPVFTFPWVEATTRVFPEAEGVGVSKGRLMTSLLLVESIFTIGSFKVFLSFPAVSSGIASQSPVGLLNRRLFVKLSAHKGFITYRHREFIASFVTILRHQENIVAAANMLKADSAIFGYVHKHEFISMG